MSGNTSTVTRKGQVTIPIEIRRRLGIQEGDRVQFVQEDGAIGIVPVRPHPPSQAPRELADLPSDSVVRRVYSIAARYKRDRPLSIEEMKAAAAQGWTERERRFLEQRRSDDTADAEE